MFNRKPGDGIPLIQLNMKVGSAKIVRKGILELKSAGLITDTASGEPTLTDKGYEELSRPRVTLEQDATLIAVIQIGQSSWLIAGIALGIERQPLKKLGVDESALLKLLHRWREEAEKAGRKINRIAVAFEACFWLARWLKCTRY